MNKLIEIKPYVGIDSILLGMNSNEIQRLLGESPDAGFNKASLFSEGYYKNSIQIFYKEPGVCEAIEIYLPYSPIVLDRELFSRPCDEVLIWLNTYDNEIEEDESSFTSYKYGFSFYAPSYNENPKSEIESVLVFEKGYYD